VHARFYEYEGTILALDSFKRYVAFLEAYLPVYNTRFTVAAKAQ
jgi:hypothetical protein